MKKALEGRVASYRIKYVQHWWISGDIENKIIDVLAKSPDDAKRIVERDLCIGGVYGRIDRNGNEFPL